MKSFKLVGVILLAVMVGFIAVKTYSGDERTFSQIPKMPPKKIEFPSRLDADTVELISECMGATCNTEYFKLESEKCAVEEEMFGDLKCYTCAVLEKFKSAAKCAEGFESVYDKDWQKVL